MGARGGAMIIGGGGGAAIADGGGAAGGGAARAMDGGGSGEAVRLPDVSAGARALADVWSCGAAFGVAGTKSGWLFAGGGTDAVIWFFGTGLAAVVGAGAGVSGGSCNARNRVTRKPETITMHAAISQPLREAKCGAGLGRDAGLVALSCATAAKTRARRADLSAWSSSSFSASR